MLRRCHAEEWVYRVAKVDSVELTMRKRRKMMLRTRMSQMKRTTQTRKKTRWQQRTKTWWWA